MRQSQSDTFKWNISFRLHEIKKKTKYAELIYMIFKASKMTANDIVILNNTRIFFWWKFINLNMWRLHANRSIKSIVAYCTAHSMQLIYDFNCTSALHRHHHSNWNLKPHVPKYLNVFWWGFDCTTLLQLALRIGQIWHCHNRMLNGMSIILNGSNMATLMDCINNISNCDREKKLQNDVQFHKKKKEWKTNS